MSLLHFFLLSNFNSFFLSRRFFNSFGLGSRHCFPFLLQLLHQLLSLFPPALYDLLLSLLVTGDLDVQLVAALLLHLRLPVLVSVRMSPPVSVRPAPVPGPGPLILPSLPPVSLLRSPPGLLQPLSVPHPPLSLRLSVSLSLTAVSPSLPLPLPAVSPSAPAVSE